MNIFYPVKVSIISAVGLALSCAAAVAGERVQVQSGTNVVPLIELYTSEGCSSCPPADKWLSRLGEALGDSLHATPLAFHVDYWNRLGWEDPFSDEAYTKRQREIAALNRQRTIYTPAFAAGGEFVRGGSEILDHILDANQQEAEVSIAVDLKSEKGNRISADLSLESRLDNQAAQVFLAVYENNIVREIGAGENEGRTLRHDFVVHHWSSPFTILAGTTTRSFNIDVESHWNPANLGLAVVVLNSANGKTVQSLNTPISTLFNG